MVQTERVRSQPSLKGCQDAGSAKHGVNTLSHRHLPCTKALLSWQPHWG